MPSAEHIRAHAGPAIFERPMRPFFLAAGVWGALALPLWLFLFATGGAIPAYVPAREWHIHEMLYGYLPAAMTGFVLTAVPNWTGRLPVSGGGLAALFLLWAAGRCAFFFSALAPAPAAAVDSAFLVSVAGLIWRETLAGRSRRTLHLGVLVPLLALANVLFHLTRLTDIEILDPLFDERLGLSAAAMMLAFVGGRMTPSFTRNWLMKRGVKDEGRLPAPYGEVDRSALFMAAAVLLMWLFLPEWKLTAFIFFFVAMRNLLRMTRWKGERTCAEPAVNIMHMGYLWLTIWFGLMAFSVGWPEELSRTTAMHALTAGAIPVTTLAVMTRSALTQSGRAPRADAATRAIYALAVAGAAIRIVADISPLGYAATTHVSGACTALAFALFAIRYWRILTRRW